MKNSKQTKSMKIRVATSKWKSKFKNLKSQLLLENGVNVFTQKIWATEKVSAVGDSREKNSKSGTSFAADLTF